MSSNGFVTLQRKMLEWEWYKDTNTKSVFLHLLLKANWKDDQWRGIEIKRGQLVTSIGHLSNELDISEQSIRTSLKRLAKTGEINKQTTNKYSVITVKNYDKYQISNKQLTGELTSELTDKLTDKQQANNNQLTTNEEFKQDKQSKQINNPPISPQGETEGEPENKKFKKPTAEEVQAYCDERKNGISGQEFVDHYTSKGWKVGKSPMKDWQAAVRYWESKRKEKEKTIDQQNSDVDRWANES